MTLLRVNKKRFRLHLSSIAANNKINCTKAFENIPTLPQVPVIGHSYLFFPGGKYKADRLTEAFTDISKKLGDIFRLRLGGKDVIFTTNADYTESLYRCEGRYPIRPSFPALLHYRQRTYGSVGVVPGNGPEWYKYRQGVTPLLKTNIVNQYRNKHEEVANNFVKYIEQKKNGDLVLKNVFRHLLKYTIEAISVVSPGNHMRCLTDDNEDVDDIIRASIDFMDGLYMTFTSPPFWKYFKTKGYKKLKMSHTVIHSIIEKHLKDMDISNSTKPELLQTTHPYLHGLLNNKSFTWNDKVMLAMEIFLGGIDATATTIAITLHYLAHNQKIQELARKESIADETSLPYLKACVKETLRICPTAGANGRCTIADTNIGGYLIPKNVLVSSFSSVTCNDERYFKEPTVYKPERWLRNSGNNMHPFASLPFGFGARMCPGRRIAEQEIVVLLKQILKSYKLEPADGDLEKIGMVYRMNRIPDREINIKFINTNC